MVIQSVAVKSLRPTQIALGRKLVKARRKGIRALARQPQELVAFILEHPIRAVMGPRSRLYVVDHHHLARALIDEKFETAPVEITGDFSALGIEEFWKQMEAKGWAHPFDRQGRKLTVQAIPARIKDMQDDPYRSLAGFVRRAGGFAKSDAPYVEFLWADFFRSRIAAKSLRENFPKGVRQGMKLACGKDAVGLPGYIGKAHAKNTEC